jgi:hypothetical protein
MEMEGLATVKIMERCFPVFADEIRGGSCYSVNILINHLTAANNEALIQ